MWIFLKIRSVDLTIAAIALTTLAIEPAWASPPLPMLGPPAGILAIGAVIGAIVIARWWRKR